MKLVIGLGNPGKVYAQTKHNVGFWLIDAFAARHRIVLSERMGEAHVGRSSIQVGEAGKSSPIDFLLAQPQTFMNRSGRSVKKLMSCLSIAPTEVIVAHDDLDLPCGTIRVRTSGRSGGHRGVASIMEALESDQFLRLKIGIGRDPLPPGRDAQDTADYVLTPFLPAAWDAVLQGVEKGVSALPLLLAGRVTEAMNQYHRR